MSLFWQDLSHLQGIKLRRSTAYHPQTNDRTEIVNKAMESYLRCSVYGQPSHWSR